MSKQKRVKDQFNWTPPHEQKGRFVFPLSDKVEERKPLLWLVRTNSEKNMVDDVFLVNLTGEVLDMVAAGNTGFQSIDDEEQVNLISGSRFVYENVETNEAVKVEEYDGILDYDSMLGITLYIKSKKLGNIQIGTDVKKGGVENMVLLWDTGETGKKAGVSEWDDD
ncbi:hypothetical protein Flexsi_1585 [Flexistipes sinusarabici DSM 4947]|uniref:Uncharacterized protein n=1 Tax=Flexistipes sinusarabici (strain ATCC 49648 / DSM 4947 / MAS 10) TaxID=717231 RepID=F8E933_FLESM|nr:hypothetical protein [Flexistipes sinusarabici]AEI15235.1 hypothetical protein Flexsi_1585 [Flexistipes sinusarabici DSM 4947]